MLVRIIKRRPRVVRHVTVRRVKRRYKVLVGTIEGAPVLSNSKYESTDDSKYDRTDQTSPPETPPETAPRDPEVREMLIKEIDESNNWARLGLQLYFGWFALQFTVNGVAVGWLFTRTGGTLPWFARLVFLVFILWNLMGMIVTELLYKSLAETDRRIKQVIETMIKFYRIADPGFYPRSPMPRTWIRTVFRFCVTTMLISLLFWTVLFVAGT